MNIVQAPQGEQWAALVDALHALTNTMTVRTHYGASHPAIARADTHCFQAFTRVLEHLSPILIAFTDGEFVICERPFPDLRERLHVLSQAMTRHDIECILVHRGMTRAECETLGATLNLPGDVPGRVREQAQAKLTHVLLRFLEARVDGVTRKSAGVDATSLVPAVREVLDGVLSAIATKNDVDVASVMDVAREIRSRCAIRGYLLETRSVVDGRDDLAAHATNVALMTGALALDAQYPEALALDLIGAALVHDIGHALLPEHVRHVPSPLLVAEEDKTSYRDHTVDGATALLLAGCPELWVMTALEHHRGVDGGGYPALGKRVPHELVRVVALASFVDHKRTVLSGKEPVPEPSAIIAQALALEERYFGKPLARRLLRALGAFPPGTVVELSSRAPALVTQANGGDPWRPQVQLLRGEAVGNRVELRELSSVGARYALSAVRAIAPPLFVLDDIHVEGAEPVLPRTSAVITVSPEKRADIDALLKEMLEDEAPKVEPPPPPPAPPPIDDLRAKLVEFLSDPPPAARPPGITKPPSLGSYSSVPPKIVEGTSSRRPPVPGGVYSSVPPRITSREEPNDGDRISGIVSRPPASPSRTPGARSSRPPRSVLVTLKGVAELARHKDLDPRAGFLFSLIDGQSTMDEVADASGFATTEAVRILEELIARGLITTREG